MTGEDITNISCLFTDRRTETGRPFARNVSKGQDRRRNCHCKKCLCRSGFFIFKCKKCLRKRFFAFTFLLIGHGGRQHRADATEEAMIDLFAKPHSSPRRRQPLRPVTRLPEPSDRSTIVRRFAVSRRLRTANRQLCRITYFVTPRRGSLGPMPSPGRSTDHRSARPGWSRRSTDAVAATTLVHRGGAVGRGARRDYGRTSTTSTGEAQIGLSKCLMYISLSAVKQANSSDLCSRRAR